MIRYWISRPFHDQSPHFETLAAARKYAATLDGWAFIWGPKYWDRAEETYHNGRRV